MKKIKLKGRVIFQRREAGKVVERLTFEKGKDYVVADDVAEHPFIKEGLLAVSTVEEAKKKASGRKTKAEKASSEEPASGSQEAQEGEDDGPSASEH